MEHAITEMWINNNNYIKGVAELLEASNDTFCNPMIFASPPAKKSFSKA